MINSRPLTLMLPLAWLSRGVRLAATGTRRHLPRLSELAGLGCAVVFLHQLWSPLVWAAAAVLLVLAGQRR